MCVTGYFGIVDKTQGKQPESVFVWVESVLEVVDDIPDVLKFLVEVLMWFCSCVSILYFVFNHTSLMDAGRTRKKAIREEKEKKGEQRADTHFSATQLESLAAAVVPVLR